MPMNRSGHPCQPGIYKIKNLVNGKFYIGSTINLRNKWSQHLRCLRSGKHHNPHLQSAWNKHGENFFQFEVIEVLQDKSKLVLKETDCMKAHDVPNNPNCYNIRLEADSNRGYKHSKATKQKMSATQKRRMSKPENKRRSAETLRKYNLSQKGTAKTNEHKRKIGAANKGRKHKEEFRKKLSLSTKGKPKLKLRGRKVDIETRNKISKARKGKTGALHNRSRPIIQMLKDGRIVREFVSSTEASQVLEMTRSSITNCLAGRSKSAGGFVWRHK